MKSLVRYTLAAVLLLASAAACNNDALPPASGFTTIGGSIVDSNGKPVAGAVITIDTVLTATTDAAGKFSVDKVPSGIVDYTIQASGYKLVSATANVEPGKPFELDITMPVDQTGH